MTEIVIAWMVVGVIAVLIIFGVRSFLRELMQDYGALAAFSLAGILLALLAIFWALDWAVVILQKAGH